MALYCFLAFYLMCSVIVFGLFLFWFAQDANQYSKVRKIPREPSKREIRKLHRQADEILR
jgi:hypothetical protein